MRVRYAHICDYQLVANDNKPSLIGIFNRVWSKTFPFRLSRPCTVFVCITIDVGEGGKPLHCSIVLRDPDMVALQVFEAELPVPEHARGDAFVRWEMLDGLEFVAPGPHLIEVSLNGEKMETIDLTVDHLNGQEA